MAILHKTRGIVLKFIKYRETSIIATIFTELFGVQSYIINGVRTRKPRYSIALFQPLTLLDMVVYHKESTSLHRISEIRCENQFQAIPYQHKRSSIALFLSEVLYKTIKLESDPGTIFSFIHNSILTLDKLDQGYENFHLQFLLKLTQYLGFYPQSGKDLEAQLSRKSKLSEPLFDQLISNTYDHKIEGLSGNTRISLLDQILEFYSLHIENMGEIHSYQVLREVLHF